MQHGETADRKLQSYHNTNGRATALQVVEGSENMMAPRFNFDLIAAAARRPGKFYLAYGSNLSLERMERRCPNAVAFGTAVIPGYRLLFKKSKTGSYATIEQDANSCVPVLVYKISEYDEAMLDRYEGYPKFYYKRFFQLPVMRFDSGKRMKEKKLCMAYRCPDAKIVGTAVLHGWQLMFKGVATIEPKPEKNTPVLVWEISRRDEANLDR
jgi:hypothetical protein